MKTSSAPQRRSEIPDVNTINLGNTTFRMRCCAAVDESGRPSDRMWMEGEEREREKENERERYEEAERQWDRGENGEVYEIEVYKTIWRKEQPPRRRFTHSRCTLVAGGAIRKARSCRRMTHLVRHTDAGVAFRVWVALLKRQAILPLLMTAHSADAAISHSAAAVFRVRVQHVAVM